MLAAQDAGYNKMSEDVEAEACSQDLLVAAKRILEFDEVVQLVDSCKNRLNSCPENQKLPSVFVHHQSFLGTECFWSL